MKRFAILLFAVLAIGVGCSEMNEPAGVSSVDTFDAKSDRTIAAPGPITYDIELVSSTYDETLDQTTFTYMVLSNPDGGPAISHWVIGFDEGCGSSDVVVDSNDGAVEWSDPDPTTDVRGIKFDTGYGDEELREVTIVLAGEWSTGEVLIAVKSGNGFVLGSESGPVCDGGDNEEEVTYTVSGTHFFDIDGDGVQDPDEPGIPGIDITLNGSDVMATDENGYYIFDELFPGEYNVSSDTPDGTTPTTPMTVDVTIVDEDLVVDFGVMLDFEYLCGQSADGYTIGFWKNNVKKAMQGKTRGVQVSASDLNDYLMGISSFALSPFSFSTLDEAYGVLNAKGSDAVLLLSKQLVGSEFNYMNGAYIGGNELLTWMFLYYGEYIIVHADDYSRDQILEAKDWYDAYNNSHGGAFHGPDCTE